MCVSQNYERLNAKTFTQLETHLLVFTDLMLLYFMCILILDIMGQFAILSHSGFERTLSGIGDFLHHAFY